jgi:hypothetical protein
MTTTRLAVTLTFLVLAACGTESHESTMHPLSTGYVGPTGQQPAGACPEVCTTDATQAGGRLDGCSIATDAGEVVCDFSVAGPPPWASSPGCAFICP